MQRTLLAVIMLLCTFGIPIRAALPADAGAQDIAQPLHGRNLDYLPARGETLMEIARRAGIGYDNLVRANPGVDPWNPSPGVHLLLPKATLLPEDLRPGITINLAELRLYFLRDSNGTRELHVYPVGIGREGWETPLGEFRIVTIVDDPSWTPPSSLREEKPDLPLVVPPGEDNPLGAFWIGLDAAGVGLHGTNQPFGVGRRVSHGCLRLYPEDIRELVQMVGPGVPVRIIDQPVKIVTDHQRAWVEVHRSVPLQGLAVQLPESARPRLQQILAAARGIPEEIRLEK